MWDAAGRWVPGSAGFQLNFGFSMKLLAEAQAKKMESLLQDEPLWAQLSLHLDSTSGPREFAEEQTSSETSGKAVLGTRGPAVGWRQEARHCRSTPGPGGCGRGCSASWAQSASYRGHRYLQKAGSADRYANFIIHVHNYNLGVGKLFS